MFHIAHLIDDTNPGGVTRYLDFLSTHPGMARLARHQVIRVHRNRPHDAPIDADIVVSHLTVTWRGLPGLMRLRAQLPRTPLVHVEHSYCAGFAAANVRASGRFQTLLRTAYALFDRVVAVSAAQADWLQRRELVSGDRLSVIRPCVDLSPFRMLSLPTGAGKTIGAIGRLDRQKGFDILIRGFRTLPDPDLRLVVFGKGPEDAALRTLAAGDDRIRFEGFAPDPAAAISRCDVIAMPSRWEPFGIVALEAAAARRPLLVAPVDGLKDHVSMGATPVRDSSPQGWAAAMASCVKPSPTPIVRDIAEDTTAGWRQLISDVGPALLPHARAA